MLIDNIVKQSTMWTVDFDDSKPQLKTPIVMTPTAHCACAVCNMQWVVCSVKCAVHSSYNRITAPPQGNLK